MASIVIRVTDRSAINALAHVQSALPGAIRRGLLQFALIVGRAVAARAPRKTGRLARSFLVPQVMGDTVLLGHGVPIYGAIHEYGGDITPKSAPALVFEVNGRWVRTQRVHIREKRYVRGGMEASASRGPALIGAEIGRSFVG